jgi:hypothetical protein
VLARRVVRVQLVQREQPRVDRGQQVRVEGAEEPGAFGGNGNLHRGQAGRVGRVHAPGQLAGHDRGGQLVAGDLVALPGGRPGAADADGGDGGHRERERGAEHDERAGGSPGKRPHASAW